MTLLKPGISVTTKLICTVLLGCGVVASLVFFLLWWQAEDMQQTHGLLQNLGAQLDQLTSEEQSFTQASSDYQRIRRRADEIRGLFPSRETLVEQVKTLERAAVQSGDQFSLTINDTPRLEAGTGTGTEEAYAIVPGLVQVEVIPYEFRLEGSFLSVVHFLQILEHQPFYSELETLLLTSNAKEGGGSTVLKRSGEAQATIRSAFYARKVKGKH